MVFYASYWHLLVCFLSITAFLCGHVVSIIVIGFVLLQFIAIIFLPGDVVSMMHFFSCPMLVLI